MFPADPVSAATHHDPYPYYNRLLAGPALVFDPHSTLWVASRAEVIAEVLGNAHCTVRPSAAQVPSAIVGSSAGAVFFHLIRMNDGAAHAAPKFALQQALAGVDAATTADATHELGALLAGVYGLPDSEDLTPWTFDLPTWVVADLLGFERAHLPQLALWMAHFVACLSPLSNADQLAAASESASALLLRFGQLLQACGARPASLLSRIQHEAAMVGWDNQDAILANLIGLLSQTHEATAGLIGNSLVALLSRPQLQEQLRRDRGQIGSLVREVARFDPPVQNTRRFVAQPTSVAGIALQPGDAILLLLAAAGRDAQANAHPNEFMLARPQSQLFGFGHGRHACPGKTLAITIATAALDTILAMPTALDAQRIGWTYRASANARLPLFSSIARPKELT